MAAAQSSGPPASTDEIVLAGAGEEAGGTHGAFAVAAHHHGRAVPVIGRRAVGQVTELDMGGTGDVPCHELGGLPDVEHAGVSEVFARSTSADGTRSA